MSIKKKKSEGNPFGIKGITTEFFESRRIPVDEWRKLNNPAECTKYFGRKLRKTDAEGKECVKLYCDAEGKIIKLKWFDGNGYLTGDRNFYGEVEADADAEDEKIHEISYEKNGSEIIEVSEEFEYDPDEWEKEKGIQVTFIQNGEIVEVVHESSMGKISKTVFKKIDNPIMDIYYEEKRDMVLEGVIYNKLLRKGYKEVECTFYDIDGSIGSIHKYYYDESGYLIKEEGFSQGVSQIYLCSYTLYHYNIAKRYVIGEIRDLVGGSNKLKLYGRMKYIYDNGYKPVKKTYRSYIKKDYDYNILYKYDTKGFLVELEFYKSGKLYAHTIYSYDNQGRKTKQEDIHSDGEYTSRTTWEYCKNGMIKNKSWSKIVLP